MACNNVILRVKSEKIMALIRKRGGRGKRVYGLYDNVMVRVYGQTTRALVLKTGGRGTLYALENKQEGEVRRGGVVIDTDRC